MLIPHVRYVDHTNLLGGIYTCFLDPFLDRLSVTTYGLHIWLRNTSIGRGFPAGFGLDAWLEILHADTWSG